MALRYALLGLISERPRYGYEIKKEFEGSIGLFWNAHLSQIYPELAKLENEGLISKELVIQEERPNKSLYTITDKGTKELKNWLAEPIKPRQIKDESLLKIFFSRLIPKEKLVANIEGYKGHCQERLQVLEMIHQYALASDDPLSDLGVINGLRHYRVDIDWCDEAISRIKRRQR